MRPRHTQHTLPSFPVYSCAFLSDNQLVVGGGGGATRSGITNKIRMYEIHENRDINEKTEFELERGEDAPMSMAAHAESSTIVCGINSTEEKLERGQNENCRVYSAAKYNIAPLRTQSTLPAGDHEDYQKVTVISPDGSLLAVGGAHDVSLLHYPSLTPASEPIHTEKEIYDIAFSSDSLIVATTHNLFIYSLPSNPATSGPAQPKSKKQRKGGSTSSEKQDVFALSLEKEVNIPSSMVGEGVFRSVRVNPANPAAAYTIINTSPTRSRQKKAPARHAYAVKWNTESWVAEKSRKVVEKGITCFDVSPDGRFLGFGSSELSIGLLDAVTLAPCATILKAHEFPPTVIKFNPSTTFLVSGSADNSLRIVTIPPVAATSGSGFMLSLLAILIVIIAILFRFYFKLP